MAPTQARYMAHGTWRGRGRGPKKRGEGRGEREGGGGEHVPSLHCHALDVPTFLCAASPRVVEEGGEAEGRRCTFSRFHPMCGWWSCLFRLIPIVREAGGQGHVLVQLHSCQGGRAGKGETGQGGAPGLFLGGRLCRGIKAGCLPEHGWLNSTGTKLKRHYSGESRNPDSGIGYIEGGKARVQGSPPEQRRLTDDIQPLHPAHTHAPPQPHSPAPDIASYLPTSAPAQDQNGHTRT